MVFTKKFSLSMLTFGIFFIVVSVVLGILFRKNNIKEGTVGIIGMFLFALPLLIKEIVTTHDKRMIMLQGELWVLGVLCMASIVLYLLQLQGGKKR